MKAQRDAEVMNIELQKNEKKCCEKDETRVDTERMDLVLISYHEGNKRNELYKHLCTKDGVRFSTIAMYGKKKIVTGRYAR